MFLACTTKFNRVTYIKKIVFLKLNFWMNNKISMNSLEEKDNFVKIKINN